MTHKIGFVEKNASVPIKSVQEKVLKEFGCDTIHICDEKFDALKAALADLRGENDVLVVYSIAIIGKHWWPKVCLAIGEAGAYGIYSRKTDRLYKFTHKEAKENYDACMEIETALRARLSTAAQNNSGKPKSGAWKHQKQIQALVDDNNDIDELAAKYGVSAATIRRIAKSDVPQTKDGS